MSTEYIGHVGVEKLSNNRFRAKICRDGDMYHLGTYDTLTEAIAAREGGERFYDVMTHVHKKMMVRRAVA